MSFLGRIFVEGNIGEVPAPLLAHQLDDDLYALNLRLGEDTFPRPAMAYLDDWSTTDHGWLRKFYPPGSDEARYALTPSVEKALRWVEDLRAREFVGTESRLNTVFELLRQMVLGADADPEHHLTELRRRRTELEQEIARAERGDITTLDSFSQRDRYQQFSRIARELLADFREVEDNFRRLDRKLRERIAGWTGSKGELLDEVLGSRTSIAESDQGRSFQAFYDFLLSQTRQDELSSLLERLEHIEALAGQDERLNHIHFDWLDASERTQGTVRLLSEQLRRFLDDQVWLENRRVFDLLHSIESRALTLRDTQDPDVGMEIDEVGMTINLPFERPLYRPQRKSMVVSDGVTEGSGEFDSSALLEQLYVDRQLLTQTVRRSLRERDQVGLTEIVAGEPLHQGLAELVSYLSLGDTDFAVVFDPDRSDRILWDTEELTRAADLPAVTFTRRSPDST